MGAELAFCFTSHLPAGLDDFVALVIPESQSRGPFRAEYEGTTLRENMGIERPKKPLPLTLIGSTGSECPGGAQATIASLSSEALISLLQSGSLLMTCWSYSTFDCSSM